MNSDLQTARDLRAAADYLRTHGMVTGPFGFGVHGGARCVMGAIGSVAPACEPITAAAMGIEGWHAWHRRVARYAEALAFDAVADVYIWSDESSVEEVLDRLESAALNLEIRALAAEKPGDTSPAEGLTVLVNS